WNGGLVYFTGKTKNSGTGATEDAYFTSISPDGEASGTDSCNLFTDLPMTASVIANAYNAQHNLTDLNEDWGNFTNFPGIGETSVQSTTVCFSPCIDSCDFKPDAVFQLATALCAGADSLAVSVTVCNDAAFELPAGTPLTFYLGNPTSVAAAAAGTFALSEKVKMGECLTFIFHVAAQPNTTIYVMLNDDGTTPRPFNLSTFGNEEECDFTNNLGSFNFNFTPPVLDLGADKLMCQFGVTVLDAGAGFASYRWQDGSIEQTYTAFNPGTYWVVATDSCGGEQTDTVNVAIDPATVLDLGADVAVCEGGSHQFNVSGFTEFAWSPADYLSCTTCPNPTVTPLSAITYHLVATNAEGCVTSDSVRVTISPAYESVADAILCEGDTLIIFGMLVTQAGDFSQTFTASNGCDSIHTVSVGVLPKAFTSENISICQGQTADIFGVPTGVAGTYSQVFQGFNSCDSTHTITLNVLPGVATSEAISICEGDTVSVFGNPVSAAGTFSQTFTGSDGCDSTHTISVSILPNVVTSETRFICAGETTDIFGAPVGVAGTYAKIFTAANGCDSIHNVHLTVNPAISLNLLVVNVTCFGGSNGAVLAQPSGGAGGFSFQWSSQQTANLPAGSYSVTVTDAAGCSVSGEAIVGQPAAVVPAISGTNLTCTSLGAATASASGGTGAFTFSWSNFAQTPTITGLSAGTYSVTATDAASCTGTASVTISGATAPVASISIDTLLTADRPDGGALSVNVSSGTAPFDILWNTGDTLPALDSLTSGQYIVTVTDAAGCVAKDTAYLFIPACTGGKIWNDFNRDGCQNGGLPESGFAGVKLFLLGTDIWGNAISDSTFSAQNGEYIFENLPPGDYQVHLVKPAGYNISAPNACTDDFLDSDFNGTTGISIGFIHLVEGHCCLIVDGGLFDACLNVTNIGTIC
ncbi:MAG: SdrD B-like domain-containing protein, partial [Bacteroidota bacterium]